MDRPSPYFETAALPRGWRENRKRTAVLSPFLRHSYHGSEEFPLVGWLGRCWVMTFPFCSVSFVVDWIIDKLGHFVIRRKALYKRWHSFPPSFVWMHLSIVYTKIGPARRPTHMPGWIIPSHNVKTKQIPTQPAKYAVFFFFFYFCSTTISATHFHDFIVV